MNIGLIGYGFMGAAHLAAIATLPDVQVTAVASRTRPGDQPPRGNLDLPTTPLPPDIRWHSDWHSVVADPSIDAIDICLPTPLHKPLILDAFTYGKHVLCEKPMALTPLDCDHLLAAARRSRSTFMVAHVLRFMTPYQIATEFLASTQVTQCTLRRATGYPQWSPWLAEPKQSGGAILDLLCHDLDQALAWFGPPHTVRALPAGPVDTVRATLLYPEGPEVTIEGGWLPPGAPFAASFEIITPASTLTFAEDKLHRNHEPIPIPIPQHDPYAAEIAYFAQCCRTGEPPTLCPPAASADAVRLATLVHQSRASSGEELSWH